MTGPGELPPGCLRGPRSPVRWAIVRRGVPGVTLVMAPWSESAQHLAPMGWEPARFGSVRVREYRCPVNGDGYRYYVQAVLDSDGAEVGTLQRYDRGTVEL